MDQYCTTNFRAQLLPEMPALDNSGKEIARISYFPQINETQQFMWSGKEKGKERKSDNFNLY